MKANAAHVAAAASTIILTVPKLKAAHAEELPAMPLAGSR